VRKDVGVFQWLSPDKQARTQVHGYVERVEKSDSDWFDHVHVMPTIDREDPCQALKKYSESHRPQPVAPEPVRLNDSSDFGKGR
jgi:hypothetical protein